MNIKSNFSMSKHLYLLQSFLFILVAIFLLLVFALFIVDNIHFSEYNKELMFVGIIAFCVIVFWLLSIFLFYKFNNLLNKERLFRQADQLQIEESEKLIQTLQSQRHDFRNQLQVIRVLAQFEKKEELIKYIDDYVSMTDISLTVPAQIENTAISAMFLVYATEARDKGINVCIDSDIDFSQFQLSPAKITRILGNIIRNSIEILEKIPCSERSIQITMWENPDYYSFLIWNNGPVIPEEDRLKIFQPGFSTKNSTGLGLSIVKELVESFDGKITLKSDLDYGTEFKIMIPRRTKNALYA